MHKLILDQRAISILTSSKGVVYWELIGTNLILTYSSDGITKAYLVPNQSEGSLHIFTEKNQIFKQLPIENTAVVFVDVPGHMLQFTTKFGTTCTLVIEEGASEFHINPTEETTVISSPKLNYLAKVLSAVCEYGKNLSVNPTVQVDKNKVTIAHHQFIIEVDVAFGLHAVLYAKTLLTLINTTPHSNGLWVGVSADGLYVSDGLNEMSVAQCIRDISAVDDKPFEHTTRDDAPLNCEVLREDLAGMLSVFKVQPYNQAVLMFSDTEVGFRVLSPECNFTSEIANSKTFLTNLAMLRLIAKVSDYYYFTQEGGNLLCLSTHNLNMKCAGQIFTKI